MKKGQQARGVFERPPGSNNWYIRFQDESGRMVRRSVGHGAKAKKKAEEEVETLRGQVRMGIPTTKKPSLPTFAELAETALEYSRGRKSSYKDDEARMKKVKERFGREIAERLTPSDIDGWLTSRDEWTDATRNRYLSLIKLTYRLAERDGKIKSNPARLVRMRKENNQRIRYLDQFKPLPTGEEWLRQYRTEEQRLRAVIREDFPTHEEEFLISLNTGLRRGEQYGLAWDNVNLERKMVTIVKSKNGETRHVPLNTAAVEAFKALLPSMEISNRIFLAERRRKGKRKALASSRHWFDKAVVRAGVRDFTWHSLRHTFCSRLVMAGVDLRTVQELMGHKTLNMTLRYSHLAPRHLSEAVEKLTEYRPPEDKSSGKKRLPRPVMAK